MDSSLSSVLLVGQGSNGAHSFNAGAVAKSQSSHGARGVAGRPESISAENLGLRFRSSDQGAILNLSGESWDGSQVFGLRKWRW